MTNKDYLNLYGLEKNGLLNNTRKMCLCGKEMDETEKVCPICNQSLSKKTLLNVNKSKALAKRYVSEKTSDNVTFKYYQLLPNGFELYEIEFFKFEVDLHTGVVSISNDKVFKTIDRVEEFQKFLNDYLPGYYNYVRQGLSEFRHVYAISNFTSMKADQLTNFMHIYLNYRALQPYLRGYKVFYYGSKVNLKDYYPDVDFNDEMALKSINLSLKMLLTWDIKNQKYIEKIIHISNHASAEQLDILETIIQSMIEHTAGRYGLDYNEMIETFNLLYNDEISLDDFIRIYNNSREDFFNKLYTYRKNYKKCVNNKIDWSTIDRIDRKTFGSLEVKAAMIKDMGVGKIAANEIYEELEKNPLAALKMLGEVSKKK